MTILARVTTLEELAVALKQVRSSKGMPQTLVDDIGGLTGGYTAKIECGMKTLGKVSLPLLLGALKVDLALVPAMRTPRTHRGEIAQFHENRLSRNARKAVMARWAKTTPKQRKKIARAAAKARWAKSRGSH